VDHVRTAVLLHPRGPVALAQPMTNIEQKRANWRAWYHRNKKKMKGYYRKRYQDRKKNETPKQKAARLKKARDYRKKYMAEKREAVNEQRRQWRKKHPAVVRARRRRHYQAHRTEILKKGRLRAQRWREKDPKRVKLLKRANWLMRKYGLTLEDYDLFLDQQSNRCALCEKLKPKGKSFNVWIECKTVQGLICNSCRSTQAWDNKR
jgi:hypothetical protein